MTAYGGSANDLPKEVLQRFVNQVARGEAEVPIDKVYEFEKIVEAHTRMEEGHAIGKIVVKTPVVTQD